MLLFEYILILLVAIFISNLINKFLPSISVPIIQVILGACIALFPLGFSLELEPELFFVLFIAPLIFNASQLADKKTLWTSRRPIMNLAFALVFITVITIGFLVNFLIPAIPIAAAFVLIAALAPTDVVAVNAVAKRINLPKKIMGILEGESIINDASGIVCFQFALAAVFTGSFSIIDASKRFLILGIGGILLGLLLTLLKYIIVRWIRSLGMENVTLHILIEILTPFLIFLIAEKCEVSGILAVFASGIAHSFGRKQLNTETASLKVASNSIWSALSFTLDGLVFLILGMQLPGILRIEGLDAYTSGNLEIIAYVLIITISLILVRFIWSFITIGKQIYADSDNKLSRVRACLIISLSGARGTVAMAIAMSTPIFLSDGTAFPARDLIILISTGVILCSLLITNFILPLFVEKGDTANDTIGENDACIEILHNVIAQINSEVTAENKHAIEMITREYYSRSINLRQKQDVNYSYKEAEQNLKIMILEWEKQNTKDLLNQGKVNALTAEHYLDVLNKRQNSNSPGRVNLLRVISKIPWIIKHMALGSKNRSRRENYKQIFELKTANDEFVLENLRTVTEPENSTLINKFISDYELSLFLQKSRSGGLKNALQQETNDTNYSEAEDIISMAFQIERDNIQIMFENGRLSRETANKMRKNISLLSLQIKEVE